MKILKYILFIPGIIFGYLFMFIGLIGFSLLWLGETILSFFDEI